MKIIETTFEKLPRERLLIGFEGENQRATVRIDCASVFAEYPNATPALIVKPLFADAYPVVVDRDGTDVVWLITSEILSFTGDGEIQLTFVKDQVICKSAIAKIRVCRSLQVTGDMPDPVVQWVDDANRKLAEVDAQIVELEGMVDTATDAATRAEQSASTASAKAEQAAGSAATATEKATEATNAAGTATAKAAEAQTAAQTATQKATAAAESERIATAKAGEATTAAGTATAKAEQATEAAQTATEKAGDASASARAAQASATDAAASATAASASETAAKASETAASASAAQAAQSAQTAGTAAQTATQKATEATQSASNAETFAGTATTKAEEAAESAQAASDAKTAVEQTAEQLADSLEQIDQNTQDIAELDERKANVDGYYPDMTVGNAEQLNSSKYVENSEPYTLRTSGGSSDIGNREYLDAVVGGTVAWNQAVRDEASENSTDFAPIVTVTDAVEDTAGVKVKIEPVQDLHGYDHPWPAGGGVNKFGDYTIVNGYISSTGAITSNSQDRTYIVPIEPSTAYAIKIQRTIASGSQYNDDAQIGEFYEDARPVADSSVGTRLSAGGFVGGIVYSATFTTGENAKWLAIKVGNITRTNVEATAASVQLEKGSSVSSTYTPYSNICPITGWDGVKVTRTGKNLFDKNNINVINAYYSDKFITSNVMRTVYIQCKPNTTYTVVNTSGNGRKTIGYTSKVPASGVNGVVSSSGTITTDSNAKYLFVFCYNGNSDTVTPEQVYDALQIEVGSTVTDYEPYAGNTYDITLPTEAGTVYGGELTVNADGSGSLVVDRKIIDLGSLDWNKYLNFFYATTPDSIEYGLPGEVNDVIKCTSYETVSYGDVYSARKIGIAGYSYQKRLCVYDSAYTTIDEIKTGVNGIMCVYPLATPITYTLTASEIRTLLGQNNVWSDAGQTALTYTGTDEHLTLESGKKYLARISGTDSMLLGSGQEITAAKGTDNVFDLTQMFGTAVADYVYGQGAAFFRKWFGKPWYPYNAGELRHVEGLQSHDTVGFNQWDEQWEVGTINAQTGVPSISTTQIRSKNFNNCLPNTGYYGYCGYSRNYMNIFWYDAEQNFISAQSFAQMTTSPNNARYFKIRGDNQYGNTYKGDICINLSHNGSRNGEYEPYEKHSYPLDSSVILRGIPKVGANGVYWDGDRYLPDGTVERRYGVVDLGTLTWTRQTDGTNPVFRSTSIKNFTKISENFVFGMHTSYHNASASTMKELAPDKSGTVTNNGVTGVVCIRDDSYTDAAAFKAAMSGVYLVYELATPTTETAQPYHSTQWVSDWGTEEFVSTGIVPVGTETRYPANLRDKLQHLPDAASGNGSYLITQTDGQMVLTPFPAPPSTAGNYVLKATVTNGVATYTWEVAT